VKLSPGFMPSMGFNTGATFTSPQEKIKTEYFQKHNDIKGQD